ncbi:MAG: hypothetical protein Q8L14_07555 [Myxococcales bacterium]|nr:hypothetical protein [Myxococcales bacterium]
MATKAELFRYDAERKGTKKPKAVKKVHHLDPAHTDTRNVTKRGDKGPSMALEDSTSGRPSRKSTRKSAHGGRNDTALMRTARAKSQTATARANRSKVARKK